MPYDRQTIYGTTHGDVSPEEQLNQRRQEAYMQNVLARQQLRQGSDAAASAERIAMANLQQRQAESAQGADSSKYATDAQLKLGQGSQDVARYGIDAQGRNQATNAQAMERLAQLNNTAADTRQDKSNQFNMTMFDKNRQPTVAEQRELDYKYGTPAAPAQPAGLMRNTLGLGPLPATTGTPGVLPSGQEVADQRALAASTGKSQVEILQQQLQDMKDAAARTKAANLAVLPEDTTVASSNEAGKHALRMAQLGGDTPGMATEKAVQAAEAGHADEVAGIQAEAPRAAAELNTQGRILGGSIPLGISSLGDWLTGNSQNAAMQAAQPGGLISKANQAREEALGAYAGNKRKAQMAGQKVIDAIGQTSRGTLSGAQLSALVEAIRKEGYQVPPELLGY